MSTPQSGAAGDRLSLPRVLVFASASVPIGALGVAATVHLPRYFAAEVGLSLALVGTVFALVRFIDIPIDTVMGLAMDRTKTRFGRYRVWMTMGAPVLMLGFYMLLMAGAGDGALYLGAWLLVMYLGYSGVFLSHLAWAGRLANTYEERSRVFGAITGLGVIGAMAVLLIPIYMSQQGATDAEGVQAMIWFIIASAAVTCLLVVATSPERIVQDQPAQFTLKDYLQLLTRGNVIRVLAADLMVTLGPGWMAALYLFYFKDSRGFDTAAANLLLLIYVAAGFAGAPFAAWLANRISKHIAFLSTTTVYSVGLMILPFLPKGDFLVFSVLMFVVGAMAAGFTVMMRAIAADIADELRLDSGREWMGLMYAGLTATAKLATAGSIFLTFNVLALVGYKVGAGVTNTPEAIRGLELAYIIGPIIFVMAAGACFIGYKLSAERHAEIRRQLDLRDASVADPGAAAEAITGVDLGPAGRPS